MAFTIDGQHSTRPIEYEVVSPDDCAGMFDILTYVKGCAVLRMLEQYLGETTFRDGIRIYLKRHAYANTVTADLWAALESASSQPVAEIMDTWILQGGYPLLSVEGSTISQEPFAYAPAKGESNIGSNWRVPVLTRSLEGGPTSAQLLEGPSMTISNDEVRVVNAGGSGFYRTAYSTDHLSTIAARLGELDEIERAVLFSDTWASILVGKSSFENLFTLAKGLVELDEPATWNVVARAIDMADRICDEPGREALSLMVKRLCGPVFSRLGWERVQGESSQAGELRAIAIGALGTHGRDDAIIGEATSRFDAAAVSGDIANAIVAITMLQNRPGDPATCEQRREAASNPQDEQRYLFAPAGSGDPAVLMATFERAFSTVRTQDAPYLIGALIRSQVAGPDIWRAATKRWDEAVERFPAGSPVAMVTGVLTFVSDPAFAVEVRQFHEANPLAVGQQQLAQVLDLMDLHVDLATRTRPTLAATFRAMTRVDVRIE
jgi:puromycin-sensitive aminopeptidase